MVSSVSIVIGVNVVRIMSIMTVGRIMSIVSIISKRQSLADILFLTQKNKNLSTS